LLNVAHVVAQTTGENARRILDSMFGPSIHTQARADNYGRRDMVLQ